MRTYPHKDAEGRTVAFEIDNHLVILRRLGRILRGAEGVTDVLIRKPAMLSDAPRAEFRLGGRDYGVIETHGDSNRYWIGPLGTHDTHLDVAALEAHLVAQPDSILLRLAWIAGWLGIAALAAEAICRFTGIKLPVSMMVVGAGALVAAMSWVLLEFAREWFYAAFPGRG